MANYSNPSTLLFPIKTKDGMVFYYGNQMNKFDLYNELVEDKGEVNDLDCSEYTSEELSLFFHHIDCNNIEEIAKMLKSMNYERYVKHFQIAEFFQYDQLESFMDDVHTILNETLFKNDQSYYKCMKSIGFEPYSLFCISKLYYCLKYDVSWQDLYRPWSEIPWWELKD